LNTISFLIITQRQNVTGRSDCHRSKERPQVYQYFYRAKSEQRKALKIGFKVAQIIFFYCHHRPLISVLFVYLFHHNCTGANYNRHRWTWVVITSNILGNQPCPSCPYRKRVEEIKSLLCARKFETRLCIVGWFWPHV
jgi:hypothetical protein